jgi:hypothetical protein
MADSLVAVALASAGAFVLLTFLGVALFRRRDPTGKAVAGYAVARQALGDTAARATSPGATRAKQA